MKTPEPIDIKLATVRDYAYFQNVVPLPLQWAGLHVHKNCSLSCLLFKPRYFFSALCASVQIAPFDQFSRLIGLYQDMFPRHLHSLPGANKSFNNFPYFTQNMRKICPAGIEKNSIGNNSVN